MRSLPSPSRGKNRSSRFPRRRAPRRLRIESLESRDLLAISPLTVEISRVSHLFNDPETPPFDAPDYYAVVTIGDNDPWTSSEVSGYRVSVDWVVTRSVDTDDGVVRVDIQLFDEDPGDDDVIDISSIPGRRHLSLLVNLEDGTYAEDGSGSGVGVTDIDRSTAGNGDDYTAAIFFEIDTDSDGLSNRQELHGVDINNDGVIDLDLPALGADPSRKDVFVEVDAMLDTTISLAPTALQTTITNVTPGIGLVPPILVTSNDHGLTTGTNVRITGIGGVPSANGDFTVTRLTANTFQLNGTTYNAAEVYTTGGTWSLPDLVGTGLAFGTSLDLVVNSFYNAPVPNPDGSNGINLHYKLNEAVSRQTWDTDADGDGLSPYGEDLNANGLLNDGIANPLLSEPAAGIDFNRDGDTTDIINEDADGDGNLGAGDRDDQIGFLGYQQLRATNFGTSSERSNPNASQILAAKARVFRYAVFGDTLIDNLPGGGVTRTTSGYAYCSIPGGFVVTLGAWGTPGGTRAQQAGTFMHELGHSLSLRHGGDDEFNNKPNYFSVMNYTWQNPDNRFQESWELDYSTGDATSPINESSISESAGLGGRAGFRTIVGAPLPAGSSPGTPTPTRVVQQTSTVDFDQNRITGTASIDLNFDGVSGQTLNDYNDWGNLRYKIPETGCASGSEFESDEREYTYELHLAKAQTLPQPDDFEGNDTLADATILGSLQTITLRDLTIDDGSDVDFFKYTAHHTGKLIVNAFASGESEAVQLGDSLQLSVQDSNGNAIGSGSTSTVLPGLEVTGLVIPVVTQEEYFIHVSAAFDGLFEYELEIENFPAPAPIAIDLAADDDTGVLNGDNATSEDQGTITILADLFDFDESDIAILDAASVVANTHGAAVEVFVGGQSVGIAAPQVGSNSTLFTFTFNPGDLSEGLNFVTAAVRIDDGKTPQADGRSQMSQPLLVTLDSTDPATPAAPDLLTSSDTGAQDDDNITSKMQPAFSGATEANAKVRVKADGVVVGHGVAASSGDWDVTVEPLADGEYEITVEAEDLAGNVSAMSDPLDVTIDSLPPQRPTLDLVADDDSGMSDLDDVTNAPNDVSFVVTAEDGSRVLIKDGEDVIDDFVIAGTTATRSITLAEGSHLLSTESFDTAGNRSHQAEELVVTVDRTPPGQPDPPDLLASSDTGMEDDDNVTSKMQPAFAGTTEANVKVRVLANGVVVGQGVATSSGDWEVTVKPLADGVYNISVEVEDLAGNVSPVSDDLQIEIDTLAPNTPFLDLVEADDSGRHNDDNITNVNTPLLSATSHDPNAANHIDDDNFKYRIYDRLEESNENLLYDSFAEIGDFTSLTHIFTTDDLFDGDTILVPLFDGIHNLKLEVEDRAGNISHDFLLDVLIDTVAPSGTARLHPDSDTGIWGIPETMEDGITADMTPSLVGETEANALVRAEIDDEPAGTAVAIPLDGDDAFPPPPEFVGNYRLDTVINLDDGDHTITVFFRDVAGNETAADDAPSIDITIDTLGPRITNVTFDGERSLFEPKPSDDGPDPLTGGIFIHFDELPDENLITEEGHYQLMGDANGNITITEVIVDEAELTVELVFGAPLYDDRYTLWVSDSLSDSAGNPLDGESGALAPFEGNDAPADTPPIFPTGDGAHGGSFHARFTIDTRPEIATYLGDGTWYVDLNGNGVFDPDNTDPTHRDIVWKFGAKGDLPVTGDWNGDGYDEIGVLGKRGGQDFFFLDLDRNGAFDPAVDAGFEFKMSGAGNGLPISGDWDGDGSDEVGVRKGNSWFIDDTATPYSPTVALINPTRIATSMRGLPIAGDWDGDGDDNVGTFNQSQFFLDTDDDFGGSELTVNFPDFDFGGLKPQPVAHDWDQDGDDDIGLFVRRETGNNSGAREAGEWFLDVNTDLSSTGTIDARFEPPPTGQPGVPIVNQDIFYNFGDEREPAALGDLRPVVGNFDPPLGVSSEDPVSIVRHTNPDMRLDVNRDGRLSPGDGLVLINALNTSGPRELAWPARVTYYLDPNGDGILAPSDVLVVFNGLNAQFAGGEGEGAYAVFEEPPLVETLSVERWYASAVVQLDDRQTGSLPETLVSRNSTSPPRVPLAMTLSGEQRRVRDAVFAEPMSLETELDELLEEMAAALSD